MSCIIILPPKVSSLYLTPASCPSSSFTLLCVPALSPVWASLVAEMLKNLPAMQETLVQSLGQEEPLAKGDGNALQYSCLGNPLDRKTWWATVHGVTKSQT